MSIYTEGFVAASDGYSQYGEPAHGQRDTTGAGLLDTSTYFWLQKYVVTANQQVVTTIISG